MNSESTDSRPAPAKSTHARLQKRRRRNLIIVAITLVVLIGLTYWETQFLEKPSLGVFAFFNLNIILLLLLILLIFRNLFKLFLERKQRYIGSRFRSKLVITFVVLSMLPTGLLAFFGSNLMADAIRNWFNPQVEEFIDDAMEIARLSHVSSLELTGNFASQLSRQMTADRLLDPENRNRLESVLAKKQQEYQLVLIQLFDIRADEIWRGFLQKLPSGVRILPGSDPVRTVLQGEPYSKLSILGNGEIVQYGVPVYNLTEPERIDGALIVNLFMTKDLTQRIRSIQRNYEAYKQQKQSIRPTQGLYVSIFLLMALTILFAAIWTGIYIARQISIPISHLDQATHEVARGNLDFKLDVLAYDEIGSLVQSFNRMTDQLRENRRLIDQTTSDLRRMNLELAEQRNQLETILQNISAGVISVDASGAVTSINSTACGLLGIDAEAAIGRSCEHVFSRDNHHELLLFIKQALQQPSVSRQKELQLISENRLSICSISFAPIWDAEHHLGGVVIVLDDLTQFLRMQRIAAWREVARRLAHEIKNPLTPIQLNAQRLQRKFQESSADFTDIFNEATATIINEVNTLRALLDEFSQFARMPEASPRRVDLHDIIRQVVLLYSGVREGIAVELFLDEAVPVMRLDSEQLKRVFINLIDNAVEAMHGSGKILIRTQFDPLFQIVRIEVADEGPGVALEDRNKLFYPYFSTKGRGSGLGLAICNRIISDHDGSIRILDNKPRGARFLIELPVKNGN
ncbi:PAS domain-containing protein [bacterium]|nr:PAS domain-containing protein [candidate division CSSED10-310 bacterium]